MAAISGKYSERELYKKRKEKKGRKKSDNY